MEVRLYQVWEFRGGEFVGCCGGTAYPYKFARELARRRNASPIIAGTKSVVKHVASVKLPRRRKAQAV